MTLLELAQRAPVERVFWSTWEARGVDVAIWRLDLLDTAASGNKLFKLDENLQAARREGYTRILSFGGAFSNHIHALALSGRAAGFETVGIIRGESSSSDNPTLRDAVAAGMHLHFVDRETYRSLTQKDALTQNHRTTNELLGELRRRFGPCYVIPEGAANRLGVRGCRSLGAAIGEMAELPDCVVLPTATGATLAGVVAGLDNRSRVLGIAVLKGGNFIADQVEAHLRDIHAEADTAAVIGQNKKTAWRIDINHHCGGYARTSAPLQRFVTEFGERTGIGIEPIYTGKMLYAIHQLIECGEFARGTRILAVHTGGMQGARAFG